MVEHIRKCSEGVGEVVVMEMEIAHVGVRTRAMAAEEAVTEKRRKVGDGELRLPSSTSVQITTEENPSDTCDAAASFSSSHVPVSCCSSNGSTEKLKFTDPEEESVETGTVARYNLGTRTSKSRSDFKSKSGKLKTTTAKPSSITISQRTVPAEKMPPAAELEEFFAAAEKDLHQRFRDKYNYDIVNDTPLKGRFEWVQLKP